MLPAVLYLNLISSLGYVHVVGFAKLSTAQSIAEVRDAAAPFAALSAGFLQKVNPENPTEGEVVLPFMLKGLDQVVADIEMRATAVSDALQTAQNG